MGLPLRIREPGIRLSGAYVARELIASRSEKGEESRLAGRTCRSKRTDKKKTCNKKNYQGGGGGENNAIGLVLALIKNKEKGLRGGGITQKKQWFTIGNCQ